MIPLILALLLPMQTPETGEPPPAPDGGPEAFSLTIFHTGAFHSSLERAAAIARIVKAERATGRHVLLLDSGNHIDPVRLETHASQGKINVDLMNLIGYDAMTLGPGELQYGGDAFARVFREASFPVLSANIDRIGSDDPLAAPYWTPLGDLGGLRVGIVGITSLEGVDAQARRRVDAWCRTEGAQKAAKRYADLLEGQVDIVIVLSNAGMGANMNLQGHRSVDLVIGGHHAAPMRQPSHMGGYRVWAPEVGYLGRLECTLRRQPRVFSVDRYEAIPLPGEPDPEVAQRLMGWRREVIQGTWDTEVGQAASEIPAAPATDLVADALRRSRAEVAFCDTRVVGRPLEEGPITRQALWELVPRSGQVVTFTLPGSRLRELVEQALLDGRRLRFAGLKYEYDPTLPEKAQVVSIRVGRGELRDERPYRCAADGWTLDALGLLTGLAEMKDTGETVVSALVEYIGSISGPLEARSDNRVVRLVPEEAGR